MKTALLVAAVFFSAPSLASVTDDYAEGYKNGTIFSDDAAYAKMYAHTTNREIIFSDVHEMPSRVSAHFTASMLYDGKSVTKRGVLTLYVKDSHIEGIEWWTFNNGPGEYNTAAAGQYADVASSGVGLAAGFAEANPLGVLILPAKVYAYTSAKDLPLLQCVEAMKTVGAFGMGAAGWNIGLMIAGPIGGIIGGIIGSNNAVDGDTAAAECVAASTTHT